MKKIIEFWLNVLFAVTSGWNAYAIEGWYGKWGWITACVLFVEAVLNAWPWKQAENL